MSRTDVRAQQRGEKAAQKHMDRFYRSEGWEPDRAGACKAFDLQLKVNGSWHPIEEKFLRWAGAEEAVLFEVVQAVWDTDWGWYHHTNASRLFWVPCERDWTPKCLYSVNWPECKAWLPEFIEEHPYPGEMWRWHESPKGYGYTLNVRVPWQNVPQHLYTHRDRVDDLPF